MHRHRFLQHIEPMSLPQPPQPAPAPSAFVMYPMAVPPGQAADQMLRQMIYQVAFQQALAVVRPSLPERDLLAVWN